LGPYNFPGHLPNGHIVPALLAGNTIVFKPSEYTPYVAELTCALWQEAGVPAGVINLLQGDKEVAQYIVDEQDVKGIFFTGSAQAGRAIQERSFPFFDRIVALEMGGNNPLIVHSFSDVQAAVFTTIQSAFLTTGQRCTALRRLIVIQNEQNKQFVDLLLKTCPKLTRGHYTEEPEPYMGPLISEQAAKRLHMACKALEQKGAKRLTAEQYQEGSAFFPPTILEVTNIQREDEELFGPVIQLIYVQDLREAFRIANDTSYGLSSGILSTDKSAYEEMLQTVQAGVINWNTPLTGASSLAPFGGLKKSGNFRPSAFYAADYTAYPVASLEAAKLELPHTLPQGFPKF
jgi:succinylglutamic semialdehyde dehydrogenase